MNPSIGDLIHFRRVCAACNKMGRQHFVFGVDDPELLPILPEFSKRLYTYDGGRRLNIWWDHSPSVLELYKMKLGGLLQFMKALIGRRDTHGYEDTRLIVLGGDHVFLMGPSKDIVPLTTDEIQNPTVAQVASRMNIEHFNYIDLRVRNPEEQVRRAESSAVEGRNRMDDFITEKRDVIQDALVERIGEARQGMGLSQLMGDSALARAALSTQETLVTARTPIDSAQSRQQIQIDFQKRAQSAGYHGSGTGVLYAAGFWPLDACEDEIVQDLLDASLETATQDYWEDWFANLSKGSASTTSKEFLLTLIIGFGWSDGNVLVTNYINRERVKLGVQPLEVSYPLRSLVRSYLALRSEPDVAQFSDDMGRSGYAKGGDRVRHDYSGVYVPRPKDFPELSIHEIARLIADGLLRLRGDKLLRSDWQHIGIAVNTGPALPPREWTEGPRVPSMVAEYVIAWRLPPDAERPAHFPPSIHDSQ